jgi:hypothetical protein
MESNARHPGTPAALLGQGRSSYAKPMLPDEMPYRACPPAACPPPPHLSSAEEVLAHAERLAAYAEDLLNRASGALGSIVSPEDETVAGLACPVRAMPPYFDNVRGRLTALESHLRALDALLERVDV